MGLERDPHRRTVLFLGGFAVPPLLLWVADKMFGFGGFAVPLNSIRFSPSFRFQKCLRKESVPADTGTGYIYRI